MCYNDFVLSSNAINIANAGISKIFREALYDVLPRGFGIVASASIVDAYVQAYITGSSSLGAPIVFDLNNCTYTMKIGSVQVTSSFTFVDDEIRIDDPDAIIDTLSYCAFMRIR